MILCENATVLRVSDFSRAEAKAVALAAQGFGKRIDRKVTADHLVGAIRTMGVLQLDSVNVFERSHYLPLFARLGNYDSGILDDLLLSEHTPASHVEYWVHEASFIPIESWPLWQFKMQAAHERNSQPGRWLADHEKLADSLLERLRKEGPATFSQLDDKRGPKRGSWWDWSDAKRTLEELFDGGVITAIGRRNFQRVYAPVEQVVPESLRAIAIPELDARRALVKDAVRALGVATLTDIADYYRMKKVPAKAALDASVESGDVMLVTVEGWVDRLGNPLLAYALPSLTIPRRPIEANTILTPFDPLTWNRERASRLFDFDYTIEIYTPAAKRKFGYYSLPVLMDDSLVARVDLKADRKTRTLIVRSAHWEERRPTDGVKRLMAVVRDAAHWRGLENIVVEDWGDASRDLRRVLG
jgi:uncharacterized protein YcaQ